MLISELQRRQRRRRIHTMRADFLLSVAGVRKSPDHKIIYLGRLNDE
jgi:hypothetical protein